MLKCFELLDENITNTVEYEVITDTRIAGELHYKSCRFSMWDFDDFKPGEKRSLCLRLPLKSYTIDELHDQANISEKAGNYNGLTAADEIVSLASLFLRCRLELGESIRSNDTPRRYKNKPSIQIDIHLVTEKERNLNYLGEFFDKVYKLDPKLQQRFILAVKMYHQAILIIEKHPDLAYLNLISAIEVLCQDHTVEIPTLSEINNKLEELINKIDDLELCNNIKNTILKREHFIKRKFVRFICDNIEDFFENCHHPKNGKVKKEDIELLLKKIYDQRSKTLHTGEPFPPFALSAPLFGSEIDFSYSMSIGEKKWEREDYIPHVHFFEKLVNHVIKTYIDKEGK